MSVWDGVEYNQISEDWRHRDNLTWQIPSVIVVIGGALIAAAFTLNIEPCIRPVLLGFALLLSLCLTIALGQNLELQNLNGKQLKNLSKKIGKETQRVNFAMIGSYLLFILCILISGFLTSILFYFLPDCLASLLWLYRHYFLTGIIIMIILGSIQVAFCFRYRKLCPTIQNREKNKD
jgi:hypothetical protein